MGTSIMYFETDRLAREEKWEAQMPTETFTCSKCRKTVRFTAKMDEAVVVTCPKCGHKVEVIIESPKKVA
jgi:putative FmdB family regulatory protein